MHLTLSHHCDIPAAILFVAVHLKSLERSWNVMSKHKYDYANARWKKQPSMVQPRNTAQVSSGISNT